MTVVVNERGQILRTRDGSLLRSGGPFQKTASGRNAIAMPSAPFAIAPGELTLIGGRVVSFEEIYRTQPWIAAAVNKRYRPIVRLPLKVYELNSQGDRVQVRNHRLVDLIKQPWKRGSAAGLKQAMFAPVYVQGNSLVAKERTSPGGPPKSFRPLDWRYLQPILLDGVLEAWETRQYGEREFFELDDVVHMHWWGPDRAFGVSPLQQLGVTVRIERSAQDYQESYLRQGARPPSGVKLPEGVVLDEVTRAEMRKDLEETYAGAANAGKPALLPGGVDWISIAHTAVEAELIEQRKVAREEVSAVYDMPPPVISNLDKATFSNITTQFGSLYTDVLGPDLVLNEQEFQAQVIDGEPAFEGLFVEYDLAGVLRGDKLKEIEALREAIGTALLKPNEGRRVLNLEAYGDVEDADNPANKLYLPTNNLTPLGERPALAPTPVPSLNGN